MWDSICSIFHLLCLSPFASLQNYPPHPDGKDGRACTTEDRQAGILNDASAAQARQTGCTRSVLRI